MGRLFGKFILGLTQEVPSGTVNGTNATFTLANAPSAPAAVIITLDGLAQVQGSDYTISGVTITMASAPTLGQTLFAHYLKQN